MGNRVIVWGSDVVIRPPQHFSLEGSLPLKEIEMVRCFTYRASSLNVYHYRDASKDLPENMCPAAAGTDA